MSVAEFRKYWKEVHGPLFTKMPGIKKYVQYHVKSDLVGGTETPIDGIGELWFESEEAQRQAYQSDVYAQVVADEPNLFLMDEHHIHPTMTEEIVEFKIEGDK